MSAAGNEDGSAAASANDGAVANVAVVGCGTIGASWAGLFLAHGLRVCAYDSDPRTEERLRRLVDRAVDLIGVPHGKARGTLTFSVRLPEALDGAEFVQENGPDALDDKVDLLAAIDRHLPAGTIVASSTSSQLRSAITARCQHPDRHIVAHPFNPPHLIPLVEITGGAAWAVDKACVFYRGLGRRPVVLKREMIGHIANRLTAALWREALYLIEQDVASVSDVDAAMVEGPGLRWAVMGPHLTYHLGGGPGGIAHFLNHLAPGHERRWADLGRPNLTAALKAKLIEGILEEVGGRSIAVCEAERDAALLAIQRARRPL